MAGWVSTNHTQFQLGAGETLLEGLERTGHDVQYQCRGGYCGSCQITLLHGSVQYIRQPLAFVPQGKILPCCAIPKTDIRLDATMLVALKCS